MRCQQEQWNRQVIRSIHSTVDATGVYEVPFILRGRLVDNASHLARLHRSLNELAMATPASDAKTANRDIIENVNDEKGFGFIKTRTDFKVTDIEAGIFLPHFSSQRKKQSHIYDRLAVLANCNAVLEFEITKTQKGVQAENAIIYQLNS